MKSPGYSLFYFIFKSINFLFKKIIQGILNIAMVVTFGA